jgi:hypothetical protein
MHGASLPLQAEIIRKCLSRSELQCSFLEYRGYKVSRPVGCEPCPRISALI